MSLDKNEKDTDTQPEKFPAMVLCPFCKSNSTNPVEAKKALAEKSFYICLVCGQIFEFTAKDQGK